MSNYLNHKSGFSGQNDDVRMGSSPVAPVLLGSAAGARVALLFAISSFLDESLSHLHYSLITSESPVLGIVYP